MSRFVLRKHLDRPGRCRREIRMRARADTCDIDCISTLAKIANGIDRLMDAERQCRGILASPYGIDDVTGGWIGKTRSDDIARQHRSSGK